MRGKGVRSDGHQPWQVRGQNRCPLSRYSRGRRRRRRQLLRCVKCQLFFGHEVLRAGLQPRFLTKEQRAQLAIEKRAQEIKEQREKDEHARREREELEKEAEEFRQRERERERTSRYGGGGGGGGGRC